MPQGIGFVAGNGGVGTKVKAPPFFDCSGGRKLSGLSRSSCGVCSTKAAQSGKYPSPLDVNIKLSARGAQPDRHGTWN